MVNFSILSHAQIGIQKCYVAYTFSFSIFSFLITFLYSLCCQEEIQEIREVI